jgi:hypothetical protein
MWNVQKDICDIGKDLRDNVKNHVKYGRDDAVDPCPIGRMIITRG